MEIVDFDESNSSEPQRNSNDPQLLQIKKVLSEREEPSDKDEDERDANGWMEGEPSHQEEEEKISRVHQWGCFYVLTLICTVLTGAENIIIFITNLFQYEAACILFVPLIVLRVMFYLLMSWKLCENWNVLFKLYFTIDKIFLTEIVEIVSVTCYVSIFYPHASALQWFYIFYGINYPLMLFSMTGYFRVMMVYCNWKPSQVILYKICLILGAVSFFGLGIYYTMRDVEFTGGANQQIDKIINDIIFLYIFAGFEMFNEIFSKVDDIDGTSSFKGGYKLECDNADMELLMNGERTAR